MEDDAQHASWIMGSAGLFLLLVFLLIGGMATASSTLIGAESQQRINEISTAMSRQQMPWKDAFVQLLEVQGVKGMILICAGGLLLSVLWPLQRILQGMVALKMQIPEVPLAPGAIFDFTCPHCGSRDYLKNEDGNRNKFCGQCGKALDWEEV